MMVVYQNRPNKWHAPVNLFFEEKKMLQFKKPAKNVLRIGILLDNSGSMASLGKPAVKSLNEQIASFKEEAARTGIETYVSISMFNSVVEPFIQNYRIEDVGEIDDSSFQTRGMTALRDAVGHMMDTLSSKGSDNSMYLLLTITDGGENSSVGNKNIKSNIATKLASDHWTFAFCTPPGEAGRIVDEFGVPIGCVKEWAQTEQGVREITRSVRSSNTALFASYSAGNTNSLNYFIPDVNNLSPAVVQTNLDDITQKVNCYKVHRSAPIRDYVQNDIGKTFRVGKNFYELTKTEEVQNYKDIVLRHKATDKFYTGDGIRSLLRLPEGVTTKLSPAQSNDYQIFVRSTSWNRKLKAGTDLLVER